MPFAVKKTAAMNKHHATDNKPLSSTNTFKTAPCTLTLPRGQGFHCLNK